MQVLQVCSFSTFTLPPAFPPCCCPLAFRRQVRRLTYRMSSESYPGSPECVVSCHGAGRLANSIRTPVLHGPCARGCLIHSAQHCLITRTDGARLLCFLPASLR